MDNFSKFYAVALQGVASGAFRECAWTGDAFKVYHGPPVDVTLRVPAMPADIFEQSTVRLMWASFGRSCSAGWLLHRRSLVTTLKVNNVPLKPVVNQNTHPDLFNLLSQSRDGLRFFYPTGIDP